MYRVLLSDDNTKLFEPWKDRAVKKNIELVCFENWEDAKIELDAYWNTYNFVILDGMGKMTDDSVQTERRHVIVPVNWFKEMKGQGKYLPVIIYSAFLKDIEEIVQVDDLVLKIFDKGIQTIDMVLDFIDVSISSTDIFKLRNKYPDLLASIDNCLIQKDRKEDLVNLLLECENNFPNNISDTIRKIRPILESMITKLYQLDRNILPGRFFKGSKTEISACIGYLAGDGRVDQLSKKMVFSQPQYMSEHIFFAATYVQKTTSSIAMHHTSETISKFSVLSCAYALIEVFNWFNDFVNTRYK